MATGAQITAQESRFDIGRRQTGITLVSNTQASPQKVSGDAEDAPKAKPNGKAYFRVMIPLRAETSYACGGVYGLSIEWPQQNNNLRTAWLHGKKRERAHSRQS